MLGLLDDPLLGLARLDPLVLAGGLDLFAALVDRRRQRLQADPEPVQVAEAVGVRDGAKQSLLPVTDLRAARSSLRSIQERWEQAGPVPRELREQLESGLRKVEDSVRRAEDAQWRRSNPEALARAEGTVAQLRSAITSLEAQLARARDRGDSAGVRKAEEALEARRSWLTEAERTLAEFSSLSREPKGERG